MPCNVPPVVMSVVDQLAPFQNITRPYPAGVCPTAHTWVALRPHTASMVVVESEHFHEPPPSVVRKMPAEPTAKPSVADANHTEEKSP